MIQAFFMFIGNTNVFLSPKRKNTWFEHPFQPDQTVKHLVESFGVPHTEIGTIKVNGSTQTFNYRVQNYDRVTIYPHAPVTGAVMRDLHQCRFILDNHLGKLSSYLRMLGFDCLYENDYQDELLAQLAVEEQRILLSRDQRLFMRKNIEFGYWLRSQLPDQQVLEVLSRYNLFDCIKPFTRCMKCNHLLVPTLKESILSDLEPLTIKYFDQFSVCPDCKQAFWQGSHYQQMVKFISTHIESHSCNQNLSNPL